ncbi:MAG: DUF2073 domain-containing protein [Candidatus Nanohaloarchaeota archaeon QJJ-9]|nr:DUF2073 domain-containing protein [Candidatus Nanohaloarchaeota archaeon QJJ-9]
MAEEGTPIEFIGRNKLDGSSFEEKLEMILDEVREGKILVLEEALSPGEKSELIEYSMQNADEEFPGIEFSSIENPGDILEKVLRRVTGIFGDERKYGLTIVGNSRVMEKVQEEEQSVSLLAKSVGGDN